MIITELYVKRPGGKSSWKSYPPLELHAIPREGDNLVYVNKISELKEELVVETVDHEIVINDNGELIQRAYLYCNPTANAVNNQSG